ncbi:hypothetical protein BpHYR1_053936, partial [Brachionus plicatilis]
IKRIISSQIFKQVIFRLIKYQIKLNLFSESNFLIFDSKLTAFGKSEYKQCVFHERLNMKD